MSDKIETIKKILGNKLKKCPTCGFEWMPFGSKYADDCPACEKTYKKLMNELGDDVDSFDEVDTSDVGLKISKKADDIDIPTSKIAKSLGKIGKLGLKSLPILGGLGSYLATGKAEAAIPILSEAEDLGSPANTLEGKLERGMKLTDEEKEEIKNQQKWFKNLRSK
jgi:hypothetical protein